MTNKPFIDLTTRCYNTQNALSLALASELSYQNESVIKNQATEWGFAESHFFENKQAQKQAFIAVDGEVVLVVFRGTNLTEWKDWRDDLRFPLVPGSWGKVHSGFQSALSSLWPEMKAFLETLRNSNRNLFMAGHSLGGAMAVLAAADLCKQGWPVFGLYTYGQPKAGNKTFAGEIDKKLRFCYFRFVNHNDVVPQLLLSCRHAGQKFYFDRNGKQHQDPFGFWKVFDQWCCKIMPGQALRESIGDHMMQSYIKNLKQQVNRAVPG